MIVKDITDFVTAKARAATHPIFGRVINENRTKQANGKPKRQLGHRANGFATQGDRPFPQGSTRKIECSFCNPNHWLSRCDKFRKQSLDERKKLIKDKKLCIISQSAISCVSAPRIVSARCKDVPGSIQPFSTPRPSQTTATTTMRKRMQIKQQAKSQNMKVVLAWQTIVM